MSQGGGMSPCTQSIMMGGIMGCGVGGAAGPRLLRCRGPSRRCLRRGGQRHRPAAPRDGSVGGAGRAGGGGAAVRRGREPAVPGAPGGPAPPPAAPRGRVGALGELLELGGAVRHGEDLGGADEGEVERVEEEDNVFPFVVAKNTSRKLEACQKQANLRETSLNSPLTKALVLKAGAAFPILASPADMSFSKF